MPRGVYPTQGNWSDDDVARLRAWYAAPTGTLTEMAAKVGRTKAALAVKAHKMGIPVTGRRTRPPRRDYHIDPELVHQHRVAARAARVVQPAQGMRHSTETRARLGAISLARAAAMSPEQRSEIAQRGLATRLDRYGTGSTHVNGSNPYSRTRGGKRADLGDRYFRSAWEANYARYLNWLVAKGELAGWEYEPETFRFEGVKRGPYTYTPDFRLTELSGEQHYHEVKGWMDKASRSRLARFAKFYPLVRLDVIGSAEYRAVAQWSRLISGWE